MDAPTSTPIPAVGSNGSAVVGKRRHSPPVQYPIQLRVNLSPAQNAALQRVSRQLTVPEGILGRMAIAQYLRAAGVNYKEPD